MPAHRPSLWVLLVAASALGLAGCEPYMSMTDRIPAQTRQAAALLSETPGYVGMMDVQTAFARLEDLQGMNWADSLRQTDRPRVRAFLDATGLDLRRDVQAIYGAIEGENGFSGILFASLTPAQLDRYLDRAPEGGGRRTTYRDTPLYRLALGTGPAPDSLSVAFVEEGLLAVATAAGRVTAMVDRHRAEAPTGLSTNDAYMALVKRVGHGSTAWLVGRDVVQTALQDSTAVDEQADPAARVSQAGLQRALATWTDRMLGLSSSSVSSLEGRAGDEVNRLKRRLREQALSVTLTDTALEGEVYLTMRDNASAASVVDVAEGAVAMMKLSADDLDPRQRDLLDEVQVERDGAVVHIQFAVDRARIRETMPSARQAHTLRRAQPSARHARTATRRLNGITQGEGALQPPPVLASATYSRVGLSTPAAGPGRSW